MPNKVSKKEWEEFDKKLKSLVATFSAILFDVKKSPEIWISKATTQLRKIDGLVYSITLYEDTISDEQELINKAMLMRKKILKIFSAKPTNDFLEVEKNNVYQTYCSNIKNFALEKIELVDETTEKLEDNFKTFDDKTK